MVFKKMKITRTPSPKVVFTLMAPRSDTNIKGNGGGGLRFFFSFLFKFSLDLNTEDFIDHSTLCQKMNNIVLRH